jgi:hypothetical protein
MLAETNSKVILAPLAMIPSITTPLAVRAFEVLDSVGNKYRAGTLRLFWKTLATRNSGNR